eukprot:PhM_4_TR15482/c0_g1_i1/m.21657/K00784/rnz; ribonuclease Z
MATLTVLGCDTPNTAPGVLLSTVENNYYLIGCPEGTQRYCVEHHHRLSQYNRLRCVVVPHNNKNENDDNVVLNPSVISGLPGLYLTISDANVLPPGHKPKPPMRVVVLCRNEAVCAQAQEWWRQATFMMHRDPPTVLIEFSHSKFANKDVTLAWARDGCGSSSSSGNCRDEGRETFQITLPAFSGNFNVPAALALGVKKGPKFSLLKQGGSVASDADPSVMVTPSQVLTDQQPEKHIIFSADGIVSFDNDKESNDASWDLLGSSSGPSCRSGFVASSVLQCILHLVDPVTFPFFCFNSDCGNRSTSVPPETTLRLAATRTLAAGIVTCSDASDPTPPVTTMTNADLAAVVRADAVTMRAVECATKTLLQLREEEHEPENDDRGDWRHKVFVLGTGCCIPSVYRNVAGNLITTGTMAIFVDCGEGTTGQLAKVVDTDMFASSAMSPDLPILIAITHTHADHHLGLWSLIRFLLQMNCNRHIVALIPPTMAELRLFIPNIHHDAVSFRSLVANEPITDIPGIESVVAVRVDHPADAFGFVFTVKSDGEGDENKIRIAVSGDTRPCDSFIRASAGGCDIMLHEATFEDSFEVDAVAKQHSTVREAVEVHSRSGGDGLLLLTHFSQRYTKELGVMMACHDDDAKVGYAMDTCVVPYKKGKSRNKGVVTVPRILTTSKLLVPLVAASLDIYDRMTNRKQKQPQQPCATCD